jgi:hypothetical protein
MSKDGYDADEKALHGSNLYSSYPEEVESAQPIHEAELKHRSPIFRYLNKAFENGVEARGIERVPEDERDGKHTIGLLLLWWSVNMVVSTVPIGVSGSSPPPLLGILIRVSPVPRSSLLHFDIQIRCSGYFDIHCYWIGMYCVYSDTRAENRFTNHGHFKVLGGVYRWCHFRRPQHSYPARFLLHSGHPGRTNPHQRHQ